MEIIANDARFQVFESGSGYPVVCIHGNGLNRDLWRHLAPVLARDYRTVVYELRGMGRSESVDTPGSKITVQDHADDLHAILDALDIGQAAIVAHAFGGFPAMQLAIDEPERIGALVMCCTSAHMEDRTREIIPHWIETAESVGMGPLVEPGLERWLSDSFRAANPDAVELYRRMFAANPSLGYAANARGIFEYDIRDQLHLIRCPTLLVSGTEDWSTPTKDHELIAERVAAAELVEVEDASHTVPEEQPEAFERLVIAFLEGHLPRG